MLLRKRVYPCDFINDWENSSEKPLPEKGEFYSRLNMEDITDSDYNNTKTKKDCKDFEVKVWVNIMIYIYIVTCHYQLAFLKNLENFLSAPCLAWREVFKSKVKVELSLTDIDMLLMIEKGITGEL